MLYCVQKISIKKIILEFFLFSVHPLNIRKIRVFLLNTAWFLWNKGYSTRGNKYLSTMKIKNYICKHINEFYLKLCGWFEQGMRNLNNF